MKNKLGSRIESRNSTDTDYVELNRRISSLSRVLGKGGNIAESNIKQRLENISRHNSPAKTSFDIL